MRGSAAGNGRSNDVVWELTCPDHEIPLQALVWTLRGISSTTEKRFLLVQDRVVLGDTSCGSHRWICSGLGRV